MIGLPFADKLQGLNEGVRNTLTGGVNRLRQRRRENGRVGAAIPVEVIQQPELEQVIPVEVTEGELATASEKNRVIEAARRAAEMGKNIIEKVAWQYVDPYKLQELQFSGIQFLLTSMSPDAAAATGVSAALYAFRQATRILDDRDRINAAQAGGRAQGMLEQDIQTRTNPTTQREGWKRIASVFEKAGNIAFLPEELFYRVFLGQEIRKGRVAKILESQEGGFDAVAFVKEIRTPQDLKAAVQMLMDLRTLTMKLPSKMEVRFKGKVGEFINNILNRDVHGSDERLENPEVIAALIDDLNAALTSEENRVHVARLIEESPARMRLGPQFDLVTDLTGDGEANNDVAAHHLKWLQAGKALGGAIRNLLIRGSREAFATPELGSEQSRLVGEIEDRYAEEAQQALENTVTQEHGRMMKNGFNELLNSQPTTPGGVDMSGFSQEELAKIGEVGPDKVLGTHAYTDAVLRAAEVPEQHAFEGTYHAHEILAHLDNRTLDAEALIRANATFRDDLPVFAKALGIDIDPNFISDEQRNEILSKAYRAGMMGEGQEDLYLLMSGAVRKTETGVEMAGGAWNDFDAQETVKGARDVANGSVNPYDLETPALNGKGQVKGGRSAVAVANGGLMAAEQKAAELGETLNIRELTTSEQMVITNISRDRLPGADGLRRTLSAEQLVFLQENSPYASEILESSQTNAWYNEIAANWDSLSYAEKEDKALQMAIVRMANAGSEEFHTALLARTPQEALDILGNPSDRTADAEAILARLPEAGQ